MRYQYRITEYTITERQDQDVVMRRTATITTSGRRYLIDNLTLNGFNKTGTLLLDNGDAYQPTWVIGDETLTYSLTPSNVLTTSLQAVSEATIRSSISTYTGIGATPVDMMSGYYLYALFSCHRGVTDIQGRKRFRIRDSYSEGTFHKVQDEGRKALFC